MKSKTFNPQIFLELLCYCVFGVLTLYLVASDTYLLYVTPRMKPYLYFMVIVMLIWAVVNILRLFRPQHIVRTAHCFVLVIPILLLLLPHAPPSTSDFSGNYQSGLFSGQVSQNSNSLRRIGANTNGYPGLDSENKRIVIENDQFGFWLSELYGNMNKYADYTVVMTGFVYKNPSFMKADEFSPARLTMTCCAGDVQPYGFICQYDKTSELEPNTWVTVEGTFFISEYEYGGQKYADPRISVTDITPAEKVDGYVYTSY